MHIHGIYVPVLLYLYIYEYIDDMGKYIYIYIALTANTDMYKYEHQAVHVGFVRVCTEFWCYLSRPISNLPAADL